MQRFKSLRWLVFPLIFALLAVPLGFHAVQASQLGGAVTGKVSSPDGYPLPAGTVVKIFESGGETLHGQAQPDLDDGRFSFAHLQNGLYVLKAVPPTGSAYTQSLPKPVSIAGSPVNIGTLSLTNPQVYGLVKAPDGTTPASAEVFVRLGDGQTLQVVDASNGSFTVGGLPVGSYWLQAHPTGEQPYWRSERVSLSVPHLAFTQSITLTLETADLWGTITDQQGVPVAAARVSVASQSGFHQTDLSNRNGFWAIGNLVDGDYLLTARPPWLNSGLLPPIPLRISLPGATNPYPLKFISPPKVVTGSVTTNTGVPVSNALVTARRANQSGQADTLTGAGGDYQLRLGPGLWSLSVHPISSTIPSDWVYPLPPQLVYFHPNNLPEARTQDFKVQLSDAYVTGTVQMPAGGVPTFTVTVSLHNNEGVGVRTTIDQLDGSFQVSLPSGGYKVIVHPEDESYLGPVLEPIVVPANGGYDLGQIKLLERDALITGSLTTPAGEISLTGQSGVEGIPVVAWRPGAPGSLKTLSGAGGNYMLPVSSGSWHVQPAPRSDQPYLYTGKGERLTIESGEVISRLNFTMLPADAALSGVLLREDGSPADDAEGWASAFQIRNPAIHNGAPIIAGTFRINVPAGEYNLAAYLPAGSPYMSSGARQVSVVSGETAAITLTVKTKDAAIIGTLWDPRNQDVVEGVNGLVSAWEQNNWTATPINSGNGAYRMEVASGLWHVNYRIDPHTGYTRIGKPKSVPVQAGQTAALPLPVIPKDGVIAGLVLDPIGNPVPGATVFAKGIHGDINDVWLQTKSAQDGRFRMAVPYGRYRLGAANGMQGWIKPFEILVNVTPAGFSGGHELQFQEPDALISGSLSVRNTANGGQVFLWAWSEQGGFTQGRFDVNLDSTQQQANGPFSLDVISGTIWHLGAVFETSDQYWFGRSQIEVSGNSAELDLLLTGPYPKPAPIVVTFDASEPQMVILADRTHIYIPAGAMPVDGEVTLRVVPIATLPHQQHANVLRYGYAFLATGPDGEPIEEHFDQDVLISFSYEESWLARQHISENWLKPAYFSTTTDQWTFPESYTVDTLENRITMQIDHFTDFALTGGPGYPTFLPLIWR